MDENTSPTRANKASSDGHIPPPTDPYVTYQTPYPRKPSDEVQNPFIEFRRLADSAFSSFFAGLPKLLGTDKFKEANIRESDQAYERFFDEQAKEFEKRIAEMVRIRAEEAEGFRKKMEQDFEERRRENEKRMEEESQRWDMMRRGLEKCPGLRPEGVGATREAESELDLYDGLRAYEASAYRPIDASEPTTTSRCPWKDDQVDKKCPWNQDSGNTPYRGWLSGLGWDGRRRAKNIPLYVSRFESDESESESNANWQEFKEADMDPFNYDDHVVPWLKLSTYSPLSLIQNWSEGQQKGCGTPGFNEIPWDEAFEDLIAVHKTGELPENVVRRLVYWGGPDQWMTEMALRGSLGSRWNEGFMVSSLLRAVNGKQWRGFDGFQDLCQELVGRKFHEDVNHPRNEDVEDEDSDDWVRLSENRLHSRPLSSSEEMKELAQAFFGNRGQQRPDRMLGAREMVWPTPEQVIAALLEDTSDSYGYDDHDKEIAPDRKGSSSEPDSRMPNSTSSMESTNVHRPESITSTLTTTTSRTLPDGSVETRRVLRKRFADGSEESSESTETKPASSKTTHDSSTKVVPEQKPKRESNKGGWFWN